MGVMRSLEDSSSNLFDKSIKIAQSHFEKQLIPLGLGKEQIEEQSLEELTQSLERVNEAIKNYQSFGLIKFRLSADANIVITMTTSESHYEVSALPLLLERKKSILERIKILRGQEKIENLQDLLKKISDDELRVKLEKEVEDLKTESQNLQQQAKEVERIQKQETARSKEELDKLSVELFERRSKVWRSFLERESVATIVGSLLLVIITTSLLVAMFVQLQPSDIINNAFLLILGYFFGQTVSRVDASTK